MNKPWLIDFDLWGGDTRLELLYYAAAAHQSIDGPRPMNRVDFTHLSLHVQNFDAVIARLKPSSSDHLRHTRRKRRLGHQSRSRYRCR